MLTYDQLVNTARIVLPSVEARVAMSYLDVLGTDIRPLDFSRAYRILVKRPVIHPAAAPTMFYEDAVIEEHHNYSGMHPRRSIMTSGTRAAGHTCQSGLCLESVRLIYVGCEDLLDRYLQWWDLLCKARRKNVESLLVEQDSAVAQRQIRDSDVVPQFVYTDLQQVMMDNMVRSLESDGSGPARWKTPKGREQWTL